MLLVYIECSMVNKNVTQIDEFVHYENDIIQDLYKKTKLNKTLKKLLNNFTFYKKYIDLIENSIDINTEDYLSETQLEESSEDIVEECFNINKNVDTYISKNHGEFTTPQPQVELIKKLICFNKKINMSLYSIEEFEKLIINDEDINKIIDENIVRFIESVKSKPKKKSKTSTDDKEKKPKKKKTKKIEQTTDEPEPKTDEPEPEPKTDEPEPQNEPESKDEPEPQNEESIDTPIEELKEQAEEIKNEIEELKEDVEELKDIKNNQ